MAQVALRAHSLLPYWPAPILFDLYDLVNLASQFSFFQLL